MDEKNKKQVEQEEIVDSLSNYKFEFCNDFVESVSKITENYKNMEKSIVTQLLLETPGHRLTTGTYRETVWKSLFELIVPKKFYIEQGVFIIDSFGRISKEVDLAIFDEMYTPYIFNYGKIKFIPIEAVAVVVQCKSNNLRTKDIEKFLERSWKDPRIGLEEWVNSINNLKTSLNSVVRIMTEFVDNYTSAFKKTQTSTRPIRILCSTTPDEIDKDIVSLFDIVLNIKKDQLNKTISGIDNDMLDWYDQLNHYDLSRYEQGEKCYKKVKRSAGKLNRNLGQMIINNCGEKNEEPCENVIMSLTFQLNQLLMILNNPMQFPHQAYVDMFNGVLKKNAKKKGGSTDGK